jgi:predicted ATPase with chaperone activity
MHVQCHTIRNVYNTISYNTNYDTIQNKIHVQYKTNTLYYSALNLQVCSNNNQKTNTCTWEMVSNTWQNVSRIGLAYTVIA